MNKKTYAVNFLSLLLGNSSLPLGFFYRYIAEAEAGGSGGRAEVGGRSGGGRGRSLIGVKDDAGRSLKASAREGQQGIWWAVKGGGQGERELWRRKERQTRLKGPVLSSAASPHCSRRTTRLAGAAPTSTIGAYIRARQRQERIFIIVYARSDWARRGRAGALKARGPGPLWGPSRQH